MRGSAFTRPTAMRDAFAHAIGRDAHPDLENTVFQALSRSVGRVHVKGWTRSRRK